MSETNQETTQALSNLEAIKSGEDARGDQPKTRLERVRGEVDSLFEDHETPDRLNRDDVSVYVADWKRKLGNAKYNQKVPEREHGKRISGRKTVRVHYSIGVAERVFEGDDDWRDVVRHEMAHVTMYAKHDESQDHNSKWKAEARRLGADPSRTGYASKQVEKPYRIACPRGCYEKGLHKRSKTVQMPWRYKCPDCGENIVSWETGEGRPKEPGTSAVDCSDLRGA